MGAYTRVRLGYDSSGRPIDTDRRHKQFYDLACEHSGVTPTIVQGAYRAGAGAAASAGTHDGGGVFDLRTWNLSDEQRRKFQWASRQLGGTCWYRTPSQGFDYHMHDGVLGHKTASSGLKSQFAMYLQGYNGLRSWAADDFKRPSPIPTFRYRKAKARPRVNLSHLQQAWARPGGRTYNPWGRKACRIWRKALGQKFMPGKKYKWRQGWFGDYMKAGTRKANKHYDITKYTGDRGDRPTWALARKLGLDPYKVKRERRTNRKRVVKSRPTGKRVAGRPD